MVLQHPPNALSGIMNQDRSYRLHTRNYTISYICFLMKKMTLDEGNLSISGMIFFYLNMHAPWYITYFPTDYSVLLSPD